MKIDEDRFEMTVSCLPVSQPIGEFYIASIPALDLVKITYFDVRRVMMAERDIERYLGIQRPLNSNRVKTIASYVKTVDACFPTAVIIAIPERCAEYDAESAKLKIRNYTSSDTEDEEEIVLTRSIARVLDGQHRLAGLEGAEERFDVNVSIFIDADIADQAAIFSTVNLAQTKVNKSLTYDLFDLMNSRSPQKTCHNIAVTLDRELESPFHKKIKRLGVATPGRTAETLTQATVVEPILRLVSANPMSDRDTYLRGSEPPRLSADLLQKHPFQHLFVDEKDFEITDIIWNFFCAIRHQWPTAWQSTARGNMLNKTNGYKAMMRLLRHLFTERFIPGTVPTETDFRRVFHNVELTDTDFTFEQYPPGSGGESKLFGELLDQI